MSLLQSIEAALGKELSLCEWIAPHDDSGGSNISSEAEKRVLAILNKVGTALRVAKMRLADSGFDERREEARRRNRQRMRQQQQEQQSEDRRRKKRGDLQK